MEALLKGDYEIAQTLFEKDLRNRKTELPAAYGLALLHIDSNWQQRSLVKAQQYISKCSELLNAAKDKNAWKDEGITSASIRATRERMLQQAKNSILQSNKLSDMDDLLANFSFPSTERSALFQHRNQLALTMAKADPNKLTELYEKYGADFKKYSPDLLREADRLQLERYMANKNWSEFAVFRKTFPTNTYARDVAAATFEKLNFRDSTALKTFTNNNPQSLLRPFAEQISEDLQIESYANYIRRTAPGRGAFEYLQKMIASDVRSKNWAAATRKTELFAANFVGYAHYDSLLTMLRAPALDLPKKSLGSAINSNADEYNPVISADGQRLYFCRYVQPRQFSSEDIYISHYQNDKWTAAVPVAELSSRTDNEFPTAVTADGNRLVVFISGKLGYSDKGTNSWSKVQFFPQTINAQNWQCDAVISADGQVMLFASNGEEASPVRGRQNRDLFVSLKQANGEWAPAQNIGPTLNTPFLERSPFLHPDMHTLYFSSDGHGGLGGMDVFKTTRLDNTWLNWSQPVNLGKDINTPDDDWGYKITSNGRKAYFSAEVNGNEDIFEVLLPASMRPDSVLVISGIVEGLNPKESAKVIVRDSLSGALISESQTELGTGRYTIVIPAIYRPIVRIEKDGIFSAPITIQAAGEITTINLTVNDLGNLKPGEEASISFQDLLFDYNEATIKPAFQEDLKRLAGIIKTQKLYALVEGHTDDTGSDTYNLELSKRRAQAVRSYLIAQGCSPSAIRAEGFGKNRPKYPNTDDATRAANRRVEIRFTKQ